MADNDKLYMIRRRSDGQYSTGGTWVSFSRRGKMWKSMGALNGHLTQVYSHGYDRDCLTVGDDGRYSVLDFSKFADMKRNPYIDCDIVEVQLSYQVKSDVFCHLAQRYQKKEESDK